MAAGLSFCGEDQTASQKCALLRDVEPNLKPKLRNAAATALRDRNCIQLNLDPAHSLLLTGEVGKIRQFLNCLDGTHTVAELIETYPFAQSALFSLAKRGLLETELLNSQLTADLTPIQLQQFIISQRSYQAVNGDLDYAQLRLTRLTNSYLWLATVGPASALLSLMLAQQQIGRIKLEKLEEFATADLPPWLISSAIDISNLLQQASAKIKLTQPPGTPAPDLIIIADEPWLDPAITRSYLNRGIPHLYIAPTVSQVAVGPLVLPGQTSCLNCAEQIISNVDRSWPTMRNLIGPNQVDQTDWALLQLSVSFAATAIISGISSGSWDNSPLLNQQWRFRLPGPRIEVHPQPASMFCECQWGKLAA